MGIFSRRKKDPELDETGDEVREAKRTLKLKDGEEKPERKKKEPEKEPYEIKVWGKKERYIVLGVFLFTVVLSGVLAMSARAWKLPNMPRLKLPSIFGTETIVIEARKDSKAGMGMIESFEFGTKPLSGVYGFFLIKLEDGSLYGAREQEVFPAATLNHLPVMLAMYKEAEVGSINLSSKYILKESDKVSGSLATKPAGTSVTYEELVRLMGQENDETAYAVAKRIVGESRVIEIMEDFGLPKEFLTTSEASPYDVAFFFKRVNDANLVSRETRDALFGFMTNSNFKDGIAKDKQVSVSHKYGELPGVVNDAGIILSDEPYILVVMSKGVIETEAREFISSFAEEVRTISLAR